ncbi:hypothetical protein ACWEV4_32995 [Streptomyces sp. NPDC003860]
MTRPGGDPGEHLADLRRATSLDRCQVIGEVVDATGDNTPWLRRGWSQALTAIAKDHAHAIVAVSQPTISPHTAYYRAALDQLQALGGGLYLLRPETHL